MPTETVQALVEHVLLGEDVYKQDTETLLIDGAELAAQSDPQALPMLLSVIWRENRIEDIAKTRMAVALYALRMSPVWHPYAETIMKGGVSVPTWTSFVEKYLPSMRTGTTIERTLVIDTYYNKLGWPIEKIAETGFSKLQTARHTVEKQIAETGTIEPEMERILEEETHEGLLMHLAGANKAKIGFSYRVETGEFFVHFPEDVCAGQAMAHVMTLERVPDNLSPDLWQDTLNLIVSRLRCTVVE
jgi:hypothetical protein